MTIGYDKIVFSDQPLLLKNLTKTKVPGTIKQKMGSRLTKQEIPDRTPQDWEISGNGVIFDTSTAATTARKALEALHDLEPYAYSDGLITGTYIIETLNFNDSESNPLHYEYTIKFTQFQQTD